VKNKTIIASMLILMMTLLYACADTNSLLRKHPEALEGITNCSECHSSELAAINHRAPDFFIKHRFFAGTQRQVCTACHHESFCADCHAHKDEIKPSDKFTDEPERNLPHRGDYMSQHKIDGRVNPVACVKCHGRQNNARCSSCHR
jgi:hypothetical protein